MVGVRLCQRRSLGGIWTVAGYANDHHHPLNVLGSWVPRGYSFLSLHSQPSTRGG